MIANFSSFIEFLAAIYVTMCLDNQLCRRFWTPDYFKNMEKILDGYDFEGSSNLFNRLKKGINKIYDRVSNLSQKKGGFMLGFCVYLLIFIGWEDKIKTEIGGYISFISSCLYVFVIVFFSKFFLCKWKFVVLTLLGLFATFVISYIYANQIYLWTSSFTSILLDLKYFLFITVLLLPILHQLWLNWIYSSVYKGYLREVVNAEYEKYKRSKDGIEKRQKNIIDKEYLEAWTDQYFNNEGSDQSITIFNRMLYNRLLKIASPNVWILCWSLLKHWIIKIDGTLREKADVSIGGMEISPNISDDIFSVIPKEKIKLDFSEEYLEYCQWKKNRKKKKGIREFCMEKSINAKDMIAWLRVNKPAN